MCEDCGCESEVIISGNEDGDIHGSVGDCEFDNDYDD